MMTMTMIPMAWLSLGMNGSTTMSESPNEGNLWTNSLDLVYDTSNRHTEWSILLPSRSSQKASVHGILRFSGKNPFSRNYIHNGPITLPSDTWTLNSHIQLVVLAMRRSSMLAIPEGFWNVSGHANFECWAGVINMEAILVWIPKSATDKEDSCDKARCSS